VHERLAHDAHPAWQTTAAHWGRRQQDLGPRQVRRHLVQLVEALLASVEE
jgi:hypothetical protein